jgi:hypothetical protein
MSTFIVLVERVEPVWQVKPLRSSTRKIATSPPICSTFSAKLIKKCPNGSKVWHERRERIITDDETTVATDGKQIDDLCASLEICSLDRVALERVIIVIRRSCVVDEEVAVDPVVQQVASIITSKHGMDRMEAPAAIVGVEIVHPQVATIVFNNQWRTAMAIVQPIKAGGIVRHEQRKN